MDHQLDQVVVHCVAVLAMDKKKQKKRGYSWFEIQTKGIFSNNTYSSDTSFFDFVG